VDGLDRLDPVTVLDMRIPAEFEKAVSCVRPCWRVLPQAI
jgi:hypothetical protein